MARGETFDDLLGLFRRYVRQETVEPLRSLGRYLLFGIAGSLMVSIGCVLVAIGVLRGFQVWAVLDGWWSWVPYLVAALLLGIVGVGVAGRIGRSSRSLG